MNMMAGNVMEIYRRLTKRRGKAKIMASTIVKSGDGKPARIVFVRDRRSVGDLFYTCCQELDDIGFVEALHRIMTLTVEQLRQIGTFCEKNAAAFFDTIKARQFVKEQGDNEQLLKSKGKLY